MTTSLSDELARYLLTSTVDRDLSVSSGSLKYAVPALTSDRTVEIPPRSGLAN
ncbi:hypothetical protein [Kocuria sp. TGY1127_2]|uniref:hypothetical protein n=1 Tax=Kocuria sp. TGY1127_2 TaxID=2711328 RepID=UPI0015C0FF39|nr:hypothetical protein [Kocuria sp. TGY1127_2]